MLRRTRQHPQTQGSGVQVATQRTTILHSAHVLMTNICNRPIARRRCCQQSAEAATERRPAGRTWWRPARTTAAAPWTAAAAGATSCSASSAPLCKSARRYCQVRAARCVLWHRRQQWPSFATVCDGQLLGVSDWKRFNLTSVSTSKRVFQCLIAHVGSLSDAQAAQCPGTTRMSAFRTWC